MTQTLTKPNTNMKKQTQNFTLIELTIVILLIGLMSGYAMMNFDNDLPESRLHASGRSIASMLYAASTRSDSRGIEIILQIDAENNRFTLTPWEGRLGSFKCPETIEIEDVISTEDSLGEGEDLDYLFYPDSKMTSLIITLKNEKNQTINIVYNPLTGMADIYQGYYEIPWLEDVPRF